jgi:hypothetical protein
VLADNGEAGAASAFKDASVAGGFIGIDVIDVARGASRDDVSAEAAVVLADDAAAGDSAEDMVEV